MNKNCVYMVVGFFALLLIIIFVSSLINRYQTKTAGVAEIVTNDEVTLADFNQENQSIYYYSQTDSKIKKYDVAKKESQEIASVGLENVFAITYSPDYSKAVVQTFNPVNGIGENWLYSLDSGNKFEVDSDIGEVAWSPDNEKIAFRYTEWDNNINQVMVAGANFSARRKITDIDSGFSAIGIGWLNDQQIYYYPLASETAVVPIYKINIETLAKTNIGQGKNYLSVKFYQDKGVAAILDDDQSKIGVIDTSGEIIITTDKISEISKTSLSDNLLLVAAPSDQGDSLYRIDINNNRQQELFNSQKNSYQISNIMIDSDGRMAYFINDKKIFGIEYE